MLLGVKIPNKKSKIQKKTGEEPVFGSRRNSVLNPTSSWLQISSLRAPSLQPTTAVNYIVTSQDLGSFDHILVFKVYTT